LYPDEQGKRVIEIQELERVAIRLNTHPKPALPTHTTGFQIIDKQYRSLPIGSYLDQEQGIFYWLPGPGYLGEFRFVFITQEMGGGKSKTFMRIKIVPKN
jgi:hypothetical protein